MAVALPTIYDSFLDYLVEKATPREILAFKVSEEAEERIGDLLERQNAGTLSAEEMIELEYMRRFDSLVSLLKAKALETLNQQ